MDINAILALIEKGLGVVEVLIAAEKDVMPAITAIKNLITGHQNGTLTQAQMDSTEATLDALIADFNEPLGD